MHYILFLTVRNTPKKGFFAYIKANPAKSTAIFLSGVAAIGLMGCAYHNREAISANFKMAINSEILKSFINAIRDFTSKYINRSISHS